MISNSRPRLQLLPLEERSNTSVTLSTPPAGTALLGSQLPATPVGEAESVSHELVVIDSRVDNLQLLLGSVLNASQLKDVVVLNPEEDGLDQLDAILKTRHDLTAIHVISHGQDGGLLLGSSWIDSAEFEKRAAEVQGWRSSLAPGADILLYGCDVAEDSDGRAFVNLVAGLTGADVAASSNMTGNRSLGGDWNLEYATGPVTTTGIALPEWGGLLNTFIVSNNGDSGAGSLRQAILDANTNPGTDAISFAIPGSGPQTIQPATPFPAVTDQVFMDASTQPGYAGAPLINIDGSLAGSGANGLVLALGSDGSLIRGLAINRFAGDGILITGLGNDTIAGNYIGTNSAGTTGLGNGSAGIELNGASGNTIGGNTATQGNLIVGNGGNGITVTGSNNIVLGNVIGMALDGVTPFGNGGAGVVVDGLLITGANNVIGGVAAGDGNIIANNAGDGVKTLGLLSTNNAIIGNSMFANGQLGIDLNGDGVTPNVLLGLGLAENYPVLTSVSTTGSTISLSGTIFSTALSLIRIDFYSNNPGENDPSGHGEGRVYLGSTSVTTGLLGGGSFNVTLPVSVPAGSSISATATADFGLLNFGSTSEFSNQIMIPGFVVSPPSATTTTEAGGSASFSVALSTQPTGNVTIPVSSSNTGEGTADKTFLTFTPANWNVPQTVTVTGVDDQVVDGNQPYTIVLGTAASTDPNYNGLNPPDVSLTNLDNDTAGFSAVVVGSSTTTEAGRTASFTVALNSQPTGDVTIPVSSSNTGEGTASVTQVTFTPANWNIPQTVIVTGVDDQVQDGDQPYTIILGAATSADPVYNGLDPADVPLTNLDNDTAGFSAVVVGGATTTEGGGTASFTVTLNSQPTGDVTIPVSSSNTGEGTVSVTQLTFTPANWNVSQTVIITGVDDQVADGNQPYTIVLGAATSSDLNFNGLDPADIPLTNLDNDTVGFSTVVVGGTTTSESGGTASFTLALSSQPTGDVTIPVSSSNTGEGTVNTTSLTFTPANWNIPQTVIITGVDDQVADGNQSYSIILGVAVSSDPNFNGLDPTDVVCTNTDNDTAGVATAIIGGSSATTESGGTVSFTMALSSQPTADVTIPISSSNTAEGTVSTSSLTFTPANWNVPQTVIVTGVDDQVQDGNQPYTILLGAATSTDPNYNGLNPA
ncbi:DUF4347 domain-containing protein, partial [Zavarzinella formosa]|uniref:DUF4347 domain-containing protein n=1 Tax=Zavarzinella formosa TaxID=360055 RepID=UPI000495EE4B